jgi:transcriptional regulator with XRE-family HTH domain
MSGVARTRDPRDVDALVRLGKNLRLLRVELDVAQDELARESGVALSHYSAMERGEINPSLLVLLRIARAADTTVEELVARVR